MKKTIIFLIAILAFNSTTLSAQNVEIKPWNYDINIDFNDSTLFIRLNIEAYKRENWKSNYFLFNRYIKIDEAYLNNSPLKFTRSNDTLYFISSASNEINLSFQYEIPCSYNESLKITKSYSDSVFAYPVQFDSVQVFCERYGKYFPVIYDNFSNYKVNIAVPETYQVYSEYQADKNNSIKDKETYSFESYDEDLRFLITKTDIFHTKIKIQREGMNFEFWFLPYKRRLLSFDNKVPKYITEVSQMDSLYNVISNRSINAFKWFNINLWEQKIENFEFIETGIFGVALNMRRFILFDRSLMNMEVIDKYLFSHEIGHLWVGYNIEYQSKGFFFLSESINEYNNLLYFKSWAGEAEYENAIKNKINMHYRDEPFFTVSFDQVLNHKSGDLKYEIIYSKGVVFVHEFCKMIGEERYLKIIRDTYYKPSHYITLTDFENSIKVNGCWDEYLKLYQMKL